MLITISAFAQPDTLWTKTFGGSTEDEGFGVQQTTDGGYVIAGYTETNCLGPSDVYIVKTDENGDTLWTNTFGGSYDDYARSVQQTTDGGYIIAGLTISYGSGSFDVYLIKTDANGDMLWTNTFGGSDYDYGYSVQQTNDGGYVITGCTFSYGAGFTDVYLIRTDANGRTLWTNTFGGSGDDFGCSVQQTTDSGYIITGWTGSYGAGGSDVYLIKTDAEGDTLWTNTFGGSAIEYGWSVQQTTDGGYVITGFTFSYGAGSADVYLIKTDANGNEVWINTFGGSYDDYARSVQQTNDGGYIITGRTDSYGAGEYDVYLIKTDANGDTLWTKTVGGSSNDYGESVQQTTDGGYIITGYTDSYGAGEGDVWLIKVDAEGTLVEDFGMNQPSSFILHPCNPNPFNPSTELTYSIQSSGEINLAIFDITGSEVSPLINGFQSAGLYKTTWNAKTFPSGIYFARLTSSNGQVQTQKLVLMK
ncbi:MAG: T9SS type A sorting domain-containing protein [FCB group bacterium]|nr:T9SS type A sorting domain-containing protein [FCB group bacterium]